MAHDELIDMIIAKPIRARLVVELLDREVAHLLDEEILRLRAGRPDLAGADELCGPRRWKLCRKRAVPGSIVAAFATDPEVLHQALWKSTKRHRQHAASNPAVAAEELERLWPTVRDDQMVVAQALLTNPACPRSVLLDAARNGALPHALSVAGRSDLDRETCQALTGRERHVADQLARNLSVPFDAIDDLTLRHATRAALFAAAADRFGDDQERWDLLLGLYHDWNSSIGALLDSVDALVNTGRP